MVSSELDYVSIFIWLYNIGAAFIILFLIFQILLITRKLDTDVIRARLFLNMDILNETWKYISIASASFAVNAITGFLRFNVEKKVFFLWEISEIIFLAAFIAMIYQWYQFVGGMIIRNKKAEK
ncbi:MAG: hypothetical protein P1P72_02290 [ANME-2 cluster archaeon]|nr:hypothetical protein [ANME-2 cluster archaeon]